MNRATAAPPPTLRDLRERLSYVPRTWALVRSATGVWLAAWLALLCGQGLLPIASVYLTRDLVDALVAALGSNASWDAARPTLVLSGLFIAVLLLTEVLKGALDWVNTAQAELVQDHVSRLVHEKTMRLDLAYYDSSDYHDRLHRVRSESGARSLALVENSGSLLQNGVTLTAMAGVLLPYGVWIPVLLFAGTLPALFVVIHFNRRYHEWWENTTPDRRWTQYFDQLLTHNATAAELRLFDLGKFYQAAYQRLRARLRQERVDQMRDQVWGRVIAGAAALIAMGAAMAWMIWRAVQGTATLGDVALFQQAFSRGQALMRTLLESVARLLSNALFVRDLFDFLAMEPRVQEPVHCVPAPRALEKGIHFDNVTFGYAGVGGAVLKGLDLAIPAGHIAAVVGPNGAGKSTLLKLLCRFYDPSDGRITIDGTDIRDFATADLRRAISVLFQMPVHYTATARENIAFGDRTAEPSAAEIEAAARAAGAHDVVMRLPQQYDTLLGRVFQNGAELSSGEWQRMALARAFLRRSPILALDEPTSFMDSWAEADWLDRFTTLARGRTALLITHRFTTAMRAHIIFVMQDGHVAESGTHEQLVAADGPYASSWHEQMRSHTPARVDW